MSNLHQQCHICDSDQLKPMKGYERHGQMVQCKNCGFVFVQQIPTNQELEKFYSSYSYDWDQYLSPITVKRYHEWLDEFEPCRKTNRILDVGCGMGFFLEVAKERGWEVYGTEFSETAVRKCQEKGITMHEGVLSPDNYEPGSFDVVTSIEVMEHIYNPQEEMQNIFQLMRPGGLFYATTPNFNALAVYYLKADNNIFHYPEHLSFYTPKTITRLLNRIGLKKKKILTTGISLTRFNMSQKKASGGETGGSVIGEDTDDEALRRAVEEKWYMNFAKQTANGIFTLTGTGHTLKAYFEKPQG